MKIRKMLPDELDWANAQYAAVQFVPSSASDLIAIAEINGVKAGLGRITLIENETGELGGIYVLPEFRGRAVAAHLVEFLLKNSPFPTLFCIPFVHLKKFYQRFGFMLVDRTMPVPQQIASKLNWCGTTYQEPVELLLRSSEQLL